MKKYRVIKDLSQVKRGSIINESYYKLFMDEKSLKKVFLEELESIGFIKEIKETSIIRKTQDVIDLYFPSVLMEANIDIALKVLEVVIDEVLKVFDEEDNKISNLYSGAVIKSALKDIRKAIENLKGE